MILRRITQHVKDQNWFAVGLDFFIVVVGVFIGLQVSNWNDTRAEQVDSALVLERLDEDFQQVLARTDRSIERHANYVSAVARVINGARSGRFDEETLSVDILSIGAFAPPSAPSSTYSELVAAGRLKLVRNGELRQALEAYDDYVTLIRDSYGLFAERLTRASDEVSRATTIEVSGIPAPDIAALTAPMEDIDRDLLAHDPEIIAALQISYTVQSNIHAILSENRVRILEIMEMIEAEKAK